MKRFILIAIVLFATFFAIWFMVDRWGTSDEGANTQTEDREVLGLTASGGAVSGESVSGSADTYEAEEDDYSDSDQSLAATGSSVEIESELAKRSRLYSSDIVNGLTSKVMDDAAEPLASETSADQMYMSFERITADLGDYVGIEGTSELIEGLYTNITVTLRYEADKGATIRYVYDSDERLVGLWYDTVKLSVSPDRGSKYTEEDIKVGRTPYVLDGKLTLPVTDTGSSMNKPPVVILVSDEDDADMDGTIGASANKPLRDMARGLALRGVASIRFNRRKNQFPETVDQDAGVREYLLKDVWAAIDSAAYEARVDSDAVYVLAWGASGEYMQALVEKRIRRVAGGIMIGTKPTSHIDVEYYDESEKIESDAKYFMIKQSTWPMMIVQGDEDFETPMKHFEKWQSIFTGRAHISYHLYSGLGHYLFLSAGNTDARDYDIPDSVNTGAITDIANWCFENQK